MGVLIIFILRNLHCMHGPHAMSYKLRGEMGVHHAVFTLVPQYSMI